MLKTPRHRQVWVSLLWGHCSFFLGSGVHNVLCVPSKSLFPQFCVKFCNQIPLPSKVKFPGGSVLLPDPQVGTSVVGPRTILIVREFIWYNCSAICGSSARQLYGGVNGDLLQEGLCHTQDCCTQSPCPCSRPPLTYTLQETLKHSKAGLAQSLWDLLVCTRFCLSPLSISHGYGV